MSVKKYFIAIVIPEPFHSAIIALKQLVAERYNSKAALRSPAHITLHMPFEWKEEKENILIESLQQFSLKEDFMIELQNFSCFSPRVIFIDVIKNEKLSILQSNLVNYVKKNLRLFNQADDMRGFHPHVTIAFRDLKKQLFNEAFASLKEQKYEASFAINSFWLLKHTGKEWQQHEEFIFDRD